MLAYHNDPKLKESVLAEMAGHREADRLVKGAYWKVIASPPTRLCYDRCGVKALIINKKTRKKRIRFTPES